MADDNLEKNIYKTYIKMIENSEDTRMFNSLFVKEKDTGKEYDVLNDGEYSCAIFVSSLLTIFGLIDRPHSTVSTLINKLEEYSFTSVNDDPRPGDIIVWEKVKFNDGSMNEHIGFYLDENRAVSTNYLKKCVKIHHPNFNDADSTTKNRKIERIYRSEKFMTI